MLVDVCRRRRNVPLEVAAIAPEVVDRSLGPENHADVALNEEIVLTGLEEEVESILSGEF